MNPHPARRANPAASPGRRALAWLLLWALALAPPGLAWAGPTGEQVVEGSAEFQREGDLTHITTHTAQTIVNYTSFDIGHLETVQIDQPNAASRILNNVLSTDPTFLQGRLFSNGQVWIVNPVGVFVGDTAVVDVGSLVVAAGRVADTDFLAGLERVTELRGEVGVAAGAQIRAAESVLLAGRHVANYGTIQVADGMIALVAGDALQLARVDGRVRIVADASAGADPERFAVVQAGQLDAGRGSVSLVAGDAYSLAMNHSGITRAREILVEGGEGGLVEVAGRLDASSDAAAESGGRIHVLGERIAVGAASLDASGRVGGGEILVGGDYQGGGALRTATRTHVAREASLRADARESGDGGRIIVWADDATAFYGSLSARGGASGGDGGFAEISGRQSLQARGSIDLGAPAGNAGTLLYDPLRIRIVGGEADGSDLDAGAADFLVGDQGGAGRVDLADAGDGSDPFLIYESEIEDTDANIILHAGRSIQTQGSFDHDSGSADDALGVVVIQPGRDLRLSVVDDGGDDMPGELIGIDVRSSADGDLTWVLSDGGQVELTTESDRDPELNDVASLSVGNIVTRGVRAGGAPSIALVAEGLADTTLEAGTLTTSGADRDGDVVVTIGGAEVNLLDAGALSLSSAKGSIDVTAIEARGGSATAAPEGAGSGGRGGDVSLATENGSISVGSIDVSGGDGRIDSADVLDAAGVADFAGFGGRGGDTFLSANGEARSVEGRIDAVVSRGGSGDSGAGGDGGDLTLSGEDALIGLLDADLSGGDGVGSVSVAGGALEDEAVSGGKGGSLLATTRDGAEAGASGGGDVQLGGDLLSLGGTGDPAGEDGQGGRLELRSVADVSGVAATNPSLRGGTLVVAGRNVFSAGGSDLLLVSSGDTSPDGPVETATVDSEGDPAAGGGGVRVLLDDANPFDRFELIQRSANTSVEILRPDGTTVIASGDVDPGDTRVHRIDEIDTDGLPTHLTYRLSAPLEIGGNGSPVDPVNPETLAVASGAVRFGRAGGKLANARADASSIDGEKPQGRILGVGAGPHVTVSSAGGVELVASSIGEDATPFAVDGVDGPVFGPPRLELSLEGEADVAASGSWSIVDVVQRSAAADVDLTLPGGDGVAIDGQSVSGRSGSVESTRVTAVDTRASGTAFFFHLADPSASSNDPGSGEPVLTIAGGGVLLGADAGFAGTGDLALEADAIDAGGQQLALIADADLDGAGAILASATASPHVANAAGLVALAGAGVGTQAAPLRTSADPGGGLLVLAGRSGSGDFRLENASGSLSVAPIALQVANAGESESVSFRGIHADAAVALGNGGRDIELSAIQDDPDAGVQGLSAAPSLGLTGSEDGDDLRFGFGDLRVATSQLDPVDAEVTSPHVQSGGDQRFGGDVLLANPRPDPDPDAMPGDRIHEVRLVAGGDVFFDGDVDTQAGEPAGNLDVSSGGASVFQGNVGRDAGGVASLESLAVDDARFAAAAHSVTVQRADFRGRVDGATDLTLRGLGSDSRLTFRGDVGSGTALTRFDADADRIDFNARRVGAAIASSADRLVAGEVLLNTATPSATVPATATVTDSDGGLRIDSASHVTLGRNEKLSVAGPLAIVAAGTLSAGDLAATSIGISAGAVTILGRSPGLVGLPGGASVLDRGVDWAANDITSSVLPVWDGVGTAPTFVLGSGGILLPTTRLPFDVLRYSARLDAITAASFAGPGELLDLTATGPRVVSDARSDLPRGERPVAPALEARFGETPPAPPPAISGEQALRYVRCRTPEGGACGASEVAGVRGFADSALATERSRDIVQRYHDLVVSAQGRQRLVAAFDPLASGGWLEGEPDPAGLYAALGSEPLLAPADEAIDTLATVLAQVSLLGLDEAEAARVRRAIAADFAAATGLAAFDAELALGAAQASGVGALP